MEYKRNDMKKRLLELQTYMRKLRLQSAIYDTNDVQLQVNDDLMDYMHYTKSVIDCRKRTMVYEDPIVYAMDQQQKQQAYQRKQEFECLCLLKAIHQLPIIYRQLLLDYYVRGVHRFHIMQQLGIVESTFYRRHQKALSLLQDMLTILD